MYFESISSLIYEAWQKDLIGLVAPEALDSLSVERFSAKLKEDIASGVENVIVYEAHDKIVGYASGNTNSKDFESEIVGLYVCPNIQQNGIGSSLFSEMKSLFKSQYKSNMMVWTLLNAPNNLFYSSKHPLKIAHRDIIISGENYPGIGFVYTL